jgi:hypothetical protein
MIDLATVDRLAEYRLIHDLSFDALADEMTEAGFPIKMRALHLALTHRTTPRDRTLYRITGFVAYLDRQAAQRPPRKARRVRATA